MRKTNIFVLVALILTAVFLIGILVVGIGSDGFSVFTSQASDANGATVSRPAKESDDMVGHSSVNDGTGHRQNTYEYSYNTEKVDGLRIDWVSGEVEVVVKSGISEIKITEYCSRSLAENEVLELSAEDGLLHVNWNSDLIALDFMNGYSKNLKIELPREFADEMTALKVDASSAEVEVTGITADRVSVNTASGSVDLEDIVSGETQINTASGSVGLKKVNCEKLSVNTVSGEIEGKDQQADLLKAKSTSGPIEFDGSYQEIEASTISGRIEIESDVCPVSAEFSSVSGSVKLGIPDGIGFEVSYESLSGNFESEFGSGTEKSGRMVYGDGSASFRFSTTSGNISIEKK